MILSAGPARLRWSHAVHAVPKQHMLHTAAGRSASHKTRVAAIPPQAIQVAPGARMGGSSCQVPCQDAQRQCMARGALTVRVQNVLQHAAPFRIQTSCGMPLAAPVVERCLRAGGGVGACVGVKGCSCGGAMRSFPAAMHNPPTLHPAAAAAAATRCLSRWRRRCSTPSADCSTGPTGVGWAAGAVGLQERGRGAEGCGVIGAAGRQSPLPPTPQKPGAHAERKRRWQRIPGGWLCSLQYTA